MLQHHSDLRMVPLLELSCPIWLGDKFWTFPIGPAATVRTSLSERVVSCNDLLNDGIKYCVMNIVFACMGPCASYLILYGCYTAA